MIGYTPPSLIGATNATVANPFMPPLKFARAAGAIMRYEYKSEKPKKQLKEMVKVLWPEKKKRLKIPFGFKFNTKDRCVVCGTHKVWDVSDPMRPTIPLHKVRRGYPMRGTYCEKHSGLYKQYEMLEQQIIAEEHGLEFNQYIPKPKMPKLLQSAPLSSLRQQDIEALSVAGWTIRPPKMLDVSKEDELFRLTIESQAINVRIIELMTKGTTVIQQEQPIQEVMINGMENK
jgi:hypothetical protein|tara:strand:- start:3862 stop:4554 length:693 start_codon:yes stop_codon:yes gene_type:complete